MIKNGLNLTLEERKQLHEACVDYFQHCYVSEIANRHRRLGKLMLEVNSGGYADRLIADIVSGQEIGVISFDDGFVNGFMTGGLFIDTDEVKHGTIRRIYTDIGNSRDKRNVILDLYKALLEQLKNYGVTSMKVVAPLEDHALIDALESLSFDIQDDNDQNMTYGKTI